MTTITITLSDAQQRALEALAAAERGEKQGHWVSSDGWYTPTTIRGTVTTTTIRKLREKGLLAAHEQRPWALYRLTDAGRAYLAQTTPVATPAHTELETKVNTMTTNTTIKLSDPQQRVLNTLANAEQGERSIWGSSDGKSFYQLQYPATFKQSTLDKLLELRLIRQPLELYHHYRLTDAGRAYLAPTPAADVVSADVELTPTPEPVPPAVPFAVGDRVMLDDGRLGKLLSVDPLSNLKTTWYEVEVETPRRYTLLVPHTDLVSEADALEADEITIPVTALDALTWERDLLRDENTRLKAKLESHVIVHFDGEGSAHSYEVAKRIADHTDALGGETVEVAVIGWESSNPFQVHRYDVHPMTWQSVNAILKYLNGTIADLEATLSRRLATPERDNLQPTPNGVTDGGT